MVSTAVIMAAGMGTRFGRYTESIPKGFVEFKGVPMVVRSIETLLGCGVERIIIGTGYHKEYYESLKAKYPMLETCFSPRYAETNSMYTLWNMRGMIGDEDFLLLESDIVYEDKAVRSLLECPHPDVMLVTPVTKFQDQYYVECDGDGVLSACSVHKEEVSPCGELVGVHKISNAFYKKMCADYGRIVEEAPKLGYEYELLRISRNGIPLHVLKVDGLQWYEIDDEADLEYAERHVLVG